jgi:beta-ribofuranosylaminobenzene 5'-phosphate synthase
VFPEEWSVVLAIPGDLEGSHGRGETEAFASLGPSDLRRTDALCRLVLLGMLPALVERDLDAFGEALHDFNRRVGEMFRPVQNDQYAHPRVAALIRFLRAEGVRGVGQSSWGPTVYAIVHRDDAAAVAECLRRAHGLGGDEVIVTTAANHGARLEKNPT